MWYAFSIAERRSEGQIKIIQQNKPTFWNCEEKNNDEKHNNDSVSEQYDSDTVQNIKSLTAIVDKLQNDCMRQISELTDKVYSINTQLLASSPNIKN